RTEPSALRSPAHRGGSRIDGDGCGPETHQPEGGMKTDAAGAYRACSEVTRAKAANFYYGIRLLPPEKRNALCAVYAFARRVDDVADGPAQSVAKLAELDRARRDLALVEPFSPDPVLAALADARTRFPLPMDAFDELIDGAEMDVRETTYE